MIAGIRFRPQGQIYYFSASMDVAVGDSVVVKTEQGTGFGQVYFVCERMPRDILPAPAEPGQEIDQDVEHKGVSDDALDAGGDNALLEAEELVDNTVISEQALAPIVRIATPEDCLVGEENQAISKKAFAFCKQCIANHGLEMKLVDVEVFFDRSKYMFYFTAPARIDFRELVKDLVREYRARIELRQIGVRHETQMIGAVGSCGMVCCCRRYLRKFAPVTIRMAKEQNIFLNPSKISGICGRLLCCLSYEQENYDNFYGKSPKIGKRYVTGDGALRVLRTNMFRDSVSVLTEANEELEMPLERWNDILLHHSAHGLRHAPCDTAERSVLHGSSSHVSPACHSPHDETEKTPTAQAAHAQADDSNAAAHAHEDFSPSHALAAQENITDKGTGQNDNAPHKAFSKQKKLSRTNAKGKNTRKKRKRTS